LIAIVACRPLATVIISVVIGNLCSCIYTSKPFSTRSLWGCNGTQKKTTWPQLKMPVSKYSHILHHLLLRFVICTILWQDEPAPTGVSSIGCPLWLGLDEPQLS
jgi:hypothetical protein